VPGGGKTTVIVSRCANMILNHKIKPEKILTLTFSKASALDMERRFQKVFGSEAVNGLDFSTIHRFCYNVLINYTKRSG
jgi:DNA helicase-2/ATP-dependent DNA helicase PcrA